MKFLNGTYYVEVKDKQILTHPTESVILRKQDEPKVFRTQNQVKNITQIRKNQKVVKNGYNQLEVKIYPKRTIEKLKIILFSCPSCKLNN